MRRSNCLVWAVAMWWRRRGAHASYIVMRRSRWGRFPHFLYAEMRAGRLRLVSYVPVQPQHKECPPPVFDGCVRWGDA